MVWFIGTSLFTSFFLLPLIIVTFSNRSLVLYQGTKINPPLRSSSSYGCGRILSLHRPISTSPGNTTPETSESQVPPTNSRKLKLELRPSPVKPPQISTNIKPPPPPSFVQTQLNAKEEPTKTSSPDSIIQSTKYDYDQAHKHGILIPPPANASKIGKLWHQAKEIFVCLLILLTTVISLTHEFL
jgi:hypothetical protein